MFIVKIHKASVINANASAALLKPHYLTFINCWTASSFVVVREKSVLITAIANSQWRVGTTESFSFINSVVKLLCGRLKSSGCGRPLLSRSTFDLWLKPWHSARLSHLFLAMSAIIVIFQQCAQVRSLSKFAQSLISPDKYPHMQRVISFSLEADVATGWSEHSCPAVRWRRVTWE